MRFALIGAGQRGCIYADEAEQSGRAQIVAVVEPDPGRRQAARQRYRLDESAVFEAAEPFFEKGKVADAVILASMDKCHYEQAMRALELGYDLLLEKPISPNREECIRIARTAQRLGRKVAVCHVLRYTTFFSEIKKILDSGELGRVMAVQHNENVGNFHMAHSFVRGNWRSEKTASPMIVQKSCHDMDILVWLLNSRAKSIASFGSLQFFRPENAPEGSTARCCDCPHQGECRFDARRCYLPVRGEWPATVVCQDQSEEGLTHALQTSDYGRCVFRCDNDVCDNQVTIIEFENGVHAAFTLSGFTNKMCRTLKIMCEHGEIRADDSINRIEITRFAANQTERVEQRVILPRIVPSGHGGGDSLLMEGFLDLLEGCDEANRSDIAQSLESHLMVFAAERARREKRTVQMSELRETEE